MTCCSATISVPVERICGFSTVICRLSEFKSSAIERLEIWHVIVYYWRINFASFGLFASVITNCVELLEETIPEAGEIRNGQFS